MPKIVDPRERRAAVAEAVLRVAMREGVENASLRKVADEAGLAIGSVRHYFTDHDELMLFTMRELSARIERRVRAHVDRLTSPDLKSERRAQAEALLTEFLPMDEVRRVESVVWQAFVTAARTRPSLRPVVAESQATTRHLLVMVLRGAREEGAWGAGEDIELEALRLHSLLDGLTVQAMADPESVTPDVLLRVLRRHVDTLRSPAAAVGAPRN
ncbi:TetR/AcrR family transcriptional regulator [Streptomyces sp. NPDC003077]|uniref:TetR/AcrR family transcriptional regulator n=1 Tax=Streptomyces sp. NPDC003077 TaxID=3154443 RepID=UPI0033A844B3